MNAQPSSLILQDMRTWRGKYEVIPRVINVAQPGAGVDWTVVVPGGTYWHIQSIVATLTTSAAVLTRVVQLTVSDGSTTYLRVGPALTQAASLAYVYSWVKGLSYTLTGSPTVVTMQEAPGVPILGGHTIAAATSSGDAGDRWSAISMYVLETWARPSDVQAEYAAWRASSSHSDAIPSLSERG